MKCQTIPLYSWRASLDELIFVDLPAGKRYLMYYSNEIMPKSSLASGVVHTIPADLRKELLGSPNAVAAWNSLTPLARNEWICWTISVKKEETRQEHVERVRKQLLEGKRRPCCWPGCPHR